MDREGVKGVLREQEIELPSWAFGNSGTRFKVFAQPGVPRDPYEKIADAAQVHKYTGVAPSVALHIPWDRVDDYAKLAAHAADLGVRIGAINSNLFQDDDYRLGSLTHPDRAVRHKAIAHHAECVEVMRQTGSADLKLWLPDGTNYPGQDNLRARQDRLAESLAEIYALLGARHRLLIEYKFFEPYFYAMDIPDWGTSLLHCLALGEQAQVVLDTGHHAPGTNIEFIVMQLLRAGRLGAFDFNSRNYADDDLIVGSADPFQLFRIMNELVAADALQSGGAGHLHARPVPQHRAEDPGPDPLGDERPGSHGQGPARRPRRTGGGPARRGRARRARRADGRLQHRRPAAAGRDARRAGPGSGPDGGLRRLRLRGKDRRRASRWPAGRVGSMT